MRDAFSVVEAWGFRHRTILTWAKDRMGTGDWLRGQTEHCLMAVRGKPVVTLTNQTTLLQCADARAQPQARRVLRAGREPLPGAGRTAGSSCSRGEARPGWVAAGAEVGKFSGQGET